MVATLLLAAALAPQAAPPANPSSVTVGRAAARVGDGIRVTSAVTTRNAVVFTVGGAKLRDFKQTNHDERTFDARLVAGEADTPAAATPRVRIDYGDCRSTVTDPTGDDRQLLPLDSRHYLVERKEAAPSPLAVQELDPTKGETHAVSADVAEQVARDAGELLDGARLAALLSDRPLAVGRPIDVPADVARSLLLGVLDRGTVSRFELTPKAASADADRVAFAATLAVAMKQGSDLQVESTFELAGEIVVGRSHGRIAALDLSGPIRFGGAKDEGGTRVEVTGTGTLTWTYRADPLDAK